MTTIHIVPHTHWDREWYLPYQRFHLKLVHLMDRLLDLLASDPQYAYYMLDGQTILLEDYLEIRPEREAEIRQYIQSGRLLVGPWYILPDEFLVSPEATIRNFLQGERDARRFGGKMKVGYIPDPFGHIGQMPQILNGFAIQAASVQRGLDEEPCEFWWQAPDGSHVLMAYLRDGYGNAWNLPASDPPAFLEMAHARSADLKPHSRLSEILLMFGTDHTEPDPATSTAIRYCNQHSQQERFLHSTLPAYLQAAVAEIEAENLTLPVVRGELRASRRHYLLPGVLSTRVWIKQRNHACETLLECWAEPFSLFASLAASQMGERNGRLQQPASILRLAWKLLLKCHPHDSICGSSIDQVHEEMRPRFDQVEQIGEELTRQSLQAIAAAANTQPPAGLVDGDLSALIPLLVFNACDQAVSGEASAQINLPAGMGVEVLTPAGEALPCWTGEENEQAIAHLELDRNQLFEFVNGFTDGRVSGPGVQAMVLQALHIERHPEMLKIRATLSENGAPNPQVLAYAMQEMAGVLSDDRLQRFILDAFVHNVRLHFIAKSVPPLGFATCWARVVENAPAPTTQPSKPLIIQNEFFEVEVSHSDGTLAILDKRSGERYTGLNTFIDGGDCGDEYNYCPPQQDVVIQPQVRAVAVEAGTAEQCIMVDLELALPDGLAAQRNARALQTKPLHIRTTARLLPGIARVDIHTWVNNTAGDHRLRVHFPTPFSAESAGRAGAYDGHFEVVERPIGVPAWDEHWVEQPVPQHPQRNFCSVSNGELGLTIANRGLREAEILENTAGAAEIALTLLRCTGWLSRDDFPARRGHAGPHLETPGAQMLGEWEFDYAILPHPGDWRSAFRLARAFSTPLRALSADQHHGQIPPQLSFLQVQPETCAVSSLKACEDGEGWLVRAVNLDGEAQDVRLKLGLPARRADHANLLEQPQETLALKDGTVLEFSAKPHQILTIRFA